MENQRGAISQTAINYSVVESCHEDAIFFQREFWKLIFGKFPVPKLGFGCSIMNPDTNSEIVSKVETLLYSDFDGVCRILWNDRTSTLVARLVWVRITRLLVLIEVDARGGIKRWLYQSDLNHAIIRT